MKNKKQVINKDYLFVFEALIDTFMYKAGQNILQVSFAYLYGQKYYLEIKAETDINLVMVKILLQEDTQLKGGLIDTLKQKLPGYDIQIYLSDNIDHNFDCPISIEKFKTILYRAELAEQIYGEPILED